MELQGAIARLQEAAINGDVASLSQLLSEHEHVLDFERYYSNQSSSFTSALHICSEKGYLEMVRLLLDKGSVSSMCLAHDSNGRNPVHVAAIGGHRDVLEVLIAAMPMAVREHTAKSHGGETVLHLCVKYGQFDTLVFLTDEIYVLDLLNSTDIYGNTVLHLAVSSKQLQMVQYLLVNKKEEINANARNANGLTAMDICTKSTKDKKDDDIRKTLKHAKALSSIDLPEEDSMKKKRGAFRVVASLIATVAFQLAVSPPGGFWQDDDDKKGLVAGESILRYHDKYLYDRLSIANLIAFGFSLMVIMLEPMQAYTSKKLYNIIELFCMRIAVLATLFSFVFSHVALTGSMREASDRMQVRITEYLFYGSGCGYLLNALLSCPRLTKKEILGFLKFSASSSAVPHPNNH